MKQDTNDVILKVITEWEQYQVNLNWDVGASDLIRHFSNIMRSMTFRTAGIVGALREVANEIDEDAKVYNEIKNDLDYGTANQEGTNY